MNTHHQANPQVQPAVPLPNGRPPHMPYTPPFPHHPAPYQGYTYQYPVQYSRHPPQPWPNYAVPMPATVNRNYQQYQHMQHMSPYPMLQGYSPMRPLPQQAPSSSAHSSHRTASPSSSNTSLPIPPSTPALPPSPHTTPLTAPPLPVPVSSHRPQFYAPVPITFGGDLPPRKSRRRRQPVPQSSVRPVELPKSSASFPEQGVSTPGEDVPLADTETPAPLNRPMKASTNVETPLTSQPRSETTSTRSITSSTTAPYEPPMSQQTTPKKTVSGRPASINVLPIVPAVPNFFTASRPSKQPSMSLASEIVKLDSPVNGDRPADPSVSATKTGLSDAAAGAALPSTNNTSTPLTKAAPKSWAELVRSQPAPLTLQGPPETNGIAKLVNGFANDKTSSLGAALSSFDIKDSTEAAKLSFIEPRGLVNTGNMCYMNSVLQILVFCVPFYAFLEKVGRQATHSFKSDTPMMDAMIMFMREFPVIDAASSVEQLRMRLKDNEFEQYGEAFIPEYVYDSIRQLPRFSSMSRGHQQDAEEFLGFLLDQMHDECSRSMRSGNNQGLSGTSTPRNGTTSSPTESSSHLEADDNGWQEVGPKQRAAITRISGAIATESPITKIFGGKFRSELRVPGLPNSVTREPYQPLPLDIGASNVRNITDALIGLTKPETLHGDFTSPRGPGNTATKQVSIETLPQVLILHLKRFQYDNAGGTQKIYKKVGYPLELEIPKEVFPQHKRGGLMAHGGLPKYRLIGVVYHHGKNASGGHYTVDVRRQEGREWIRFDDTIIKRIRSEDVAEGGSEEDPKLLAAALQQHKNDNDLAKNANFYEQIGAEDEEHAKSETPWSHVNGSGTAVPSKKWSSIANGIVTPVKSSSGKATPQSSVTDKKTAYILFYQRVDF